MRLIAIGISPLCGGPSGPPRAAMLLSGSGIFAENIFSLFIVAVG